MENKVYYGAYNGEYLEHYGVPGMRWGFRKTPEQLARRVSKLQRKNEQLDRHLNANKEVSMHKKLNKGKALLSKADRLQRKRDRFQKKAVPGFLRSTRKAAKYQVKANKYAARAAKKRIKGEMLTSKARDYIERRDSYKAKIQRNKRLMSMYNNTISGLNDGSIKAGKVFMRYRSPDI